MTSAQTPDDAKPEAIATPTSQGFDPGPLGRALRWPIRAVAIVVILPSQVGWELLEASSRAVWRRAQPAARIVVVPLRFIGRWLGRGIELLFRWLWLAVSRTVYGIARALYTILFYPGWFTYQAGKEAARLKRLADQGNGALRRGLFQNFRAIRQSDKPTIAKLLRLLHQTLLFPYAWFLLSLALMARACWRLYKRARKQVRAAAKWLFGMPLRGLVYLVRLVAHSLAEGAALGYRIGRVIGRKLVAGLLAIWLFIWRSRVGRAVRAAGTAIRTMMRRVRIWYRREVSGPIGAALRSARQDVRRALTGRDREGKAVDRRALVNEQPNVNDRDDRMTDCGRPD